MALFDDPIVWLLIVVLVVFLFGASKIPGLAKAFGQARKEYDKAAKVEGTSTPAMPSQNVPASETGSTSFPSLDDPLVAAAQREGIQTTGKTREQIASELSWKLNKK